MKPIILATSKDHLQDLIQKTIETEGFECDLNYIDVSQIWNMSHLFQDTHFNGDISKWDVSRVVTMREMFQGSTFNGDLSSWNVSKTHELFCAFDQSMFRGDISRWCINHDRYARLFDPVEAENFEEANIYHWFLALRGWPLTRPDWAQHVDGFAPMLDSLSVSKTQGALLMHQKWNHKKIGFIQDSYLVGIDPPEFEF